MGSTDVGVFHVISGVLPKATFFFSIRPMAEGNLRSKRITILKFKNDGWRFTCLDPNEDPFRMVLAESTS